MSEFIKLKEYCNKLGLSYNTGYKWFKENKIEGAYKTASGTILVPKDLDSGASLTEKSEAVSFLLEKAAEFQNNDATFTDFVSFIIVNFKIELNESSKIINKRKISNEDNQNYLKQYIPSKTDAEKMKSKTIAVKKMALLSKVNKLMNDLFLKKSFLNEYDFSIESDKEEVDLLSKFLSEKIGDDAYVWGFVPSHGLKNAPGRVKLGLKPFKDSSLEEIKNFLEDYKVIEVNNG